METRALAIAFFYAIGTGVGGITGPLLFGHLIDSGRSQSGGARLLHRRRGDGVGGIAELFLGVERRAEQLEDIAKPLTVEEAEEGAPARRPRSRRPAATAPMTRRPSGCRRRPRRNGRGRSSTGPGRTSSRQRRPRASTTRCGRKRRSRRSPTFMRRPSTSGRTRRLEGERGERAEDEGERRASRQRAAGAVQRAEAYDREAAARAADEPGDERLQEGLASAAHERARAREQRAAAETARAAANWDGAPGTSRRRGPSSTYDGRRLMRRGTACTRPTERPTRRDARSSSMMPRTRPSARSPRRSVCMPPNGASTPTSSVTRADGRSSGAPPRRPNGGRPSARSGSGGGWRQAFARASGLASVPAGARASPVLAPDGGAIERRRDGRRQGARPRDRGDREGIEERGATAGRSWRERSAPATGARDGSAKRCARRSKRAAP